MSDRLAPVICINCGYNRSEFLCREDCFAVPEKTSVEPIADNVSYALLEHNKAERRKEKEEVYRRIIARSAHLFDKD